VKTTLLCLMLALFASACSGQTQTSADGTPQFSITANDVVSVQIKTNSSPASGFSVEIRFTDKAAGTFEKFTQEHVHQKTQLLVDSKVVAEPTVMSPITTPKLQITFSSLDKAQAVAAALTKK